MPIDRRSPLRALLAGALTFPGAAHAADLKVAIAPSSPQTVYRSSVDGCAPIDTPDLNPRAYRTADGDVTMFTLHYVNRALRGPDLSHLKIDCAVALNSALDAEPSHYNDRRYVTATWTDDGKHVAAIVHHEYHAEDHGRCAFKETIRCWYNTVLSFSSNDGGHAFAMDKPAVVASAPFPQDVGQGRHRGFFNPSNIVADGRFKYFMSSTTGWEGQPYGPCLFRSANPMDSASWRAFDGKDFTIRYMDPYAKGRETPQACAVVGPFGLPVGSLTRHAASGLWIAAWAATKNDAAIPVDGVYTATSTNLRDWSAPNLLLAGATDMEHACGGSLIQYPSIIDENAKGRNFDDTGGAPWLYYVNITMRGCETGERVLARRKLTISTGRSSAEKRP
jgi:hypothetical protein